MSMDSELKRALEKWRIHRAGPFFGSSAPSDRAVDRLPSDFVAIAREYGGCEGFLGDTYLRLFQLDELESANAAYELQKYAPDLLLFGTDGGGDAFAFALPGFRVVQVPLIPLSAELADILAPNFRSFILSLATAGESADANPETLGLEVHEIHPVCLGGDPVSPKNKAYVPLAKHAELAAYWNKVYARQRGGDVGSPRPVAGGAWGGRADASAAWVGGALGSALAALDLYAVALNETNHTSLPLIWVGLACAGVALAGGAALAFGEARSGVRRRTAWWLLAAGLAGTANLVALDVLNIMMGYQRWVAKGMPPKPF